MTSSRGWTGWVDLIAPEQWRVYQRVMEEASSAGIDFALAGAFATAVHTGRWRDTNDMDLYILPADRERLARLIEQIGLTDMYEVSPYDRDWTFRATDGNVIVEAIWSMRNHRASVDSEWVERSSEVEIRGMKVRVAPLEEMIWPKLYVLMRERCDWPDVLNYLYYCAEGLDWRHLLDRLGEDKPLLGTVLMLFAWINPDRVSTIPAWVWQNPGVQVSAAGSAEDGLRRAALLSTRNWYGPMAEGSKMEKSR
jgi:hypothetical protein